MLRKQLKLGEDSGADTQLIFLDLMRPEIGQPPLCFCSALAHCVAQLRIVLEAECAALRISASSAAAEVDLPRIFGEFLGRASPHRERRVGVGRAREGPVGMLPNEDYSVEAMVMLVGLLFHSF